MKHAFLLVLACASGVAIAAAPPKEAGSTIVGDREAAVGLFLDSWHEESPSDLDWPPVHEPEPLAPLDPAAVRRAIELETAREAIRRAELQDH